MSKRSTNRRPPLPLAVLSDPSSSTVQDCYPRKFRVEAHPEGGLRLLISRWLPVHYDRQPLYTRFPPECRAMLKEYAEQQASPDRAEAARRLLILIETRDWSMATAGSTKFTRPALYYLAVRTIRNGAQYLVKRFG